MYNEKMHSFIREIWSVGNELGLTNADIHKVFTSVIDKEEDKDQQLCCSRSKRQKISCQRKAFVSLWQMTVIILTVVKVCAIASALGIFCFAAIYLHNPSQKFVMRNIQDMIYPFMTSLRYISLPILKRYPYLSQWYSEECLIKNGFFDQSNIDCRPCEKEVTPVYAVGLSFFSETYYNSGKLLVISDAMHKNVTANSILDGIDINEEIDLGTLKCYSKSKEVSIESQVRRLLSVVNDVHIEWKINRLETLHLIRKLFPRVYVIPLETEVSLHRYLFVDGPMSGPYSLPLTEFANVVLIQGEGKSLITMFPSNHCKTICQPVDVYLDPSQVLFFNWIYWRPLRHGGNHTSTLLMSSFY